MLSRADQGSVENDGRGRKTITTVSSVEHCYLICNRVMLVDAFFAKCTSQSNSPKKREATCRTLWSVTRAFAFRISSEREFVGFMGVNERKERERERERENTDREGKLNCQPPLTCSHVAGPIYIYPQRAAKSKHSLG